jgi:two-component system cell cycle sensor histidine kinase/response regulator CckA
MTTPLRALVVEDSEDDTALLVRELRRGGYEVTFERIDSPAAMSKALAEKEWDIVICDYSMPHFSGTDALKILRAKDSEVPFIFLSGTIGEETAVAALKNGAQDYLMKDDLKRLLPAVQRELRETVQRRERKQLEAQVQRLQKFEAIGRLAGGIAHDFNNALGVILGWAQLGYDEAGRDKQLQLQEKFQAIRDEAQRSAGLTAQLLAFARRQVLQPRNLNLNELASDASSLLRTVVGEKIEFQTALASDLCCVRADPTQIHQVLMNLFLNARDAMPQGGRIVLETQNVEIGEDFCMIHSYGRPGRYALLSVSDTGEGMDAATLDRIFEPFFTTKAMGRGTGLGLAMVYGIVKQHDGFLNVYSELGQGTTFRVYFPASLGVPEVSKAPAVSPVRGGSETILVAEDHAALRELFRQVLAAHGYDVILASDGEEAVRLFLARSEQIRLVVLDVSMPVLNGLGAYSQMCAIKPGVPAIFTSGHAKEFVKSSRVEGADFLQKPFEAETLVRIVRKTLDR